MMEQVKILTKNSNSFKIPADKAKEIERMAFNEINPLAKKYFATNAQAEFYSRKLSYFWPKMLETQYANINFRNYVDIQGAPVHAVDAVYELSTFVGSANLKSNNTNDSDSANVYVQEMSTKIVQMVVDFELDFVQKAAMDYAASNGSQGPSSQLMLMLLKTIARMKEAKLNNLCLFGDSVAGLTGMLNNPSVPTATAAQTWATATDEQKLQNLLDTYNAVITQSNGVFRPNTMVMGLKKLQSLNGIPRSIYSNYTITEWATKNMQGVTQIIGDPFLDGTGTGGSDLIIALDKNPEHASMFIAAENIMMPIEYKGVKTIQTFLSRASSYTLIQQQSIFKLDGI